MREFIVFMFQGIYTILACMIDNGFVNKMSMDAVIAYGSYIPITITLMHLYHIGKYAYANVFKKPKTCFVVGFTISILEMLILLPVYKNIHYLCDLSKSQIDVFNDLILTFLITMPLYQIGEFCYTYAMQNLKNKIVIVADVVYWCIALPADLIVFLIGGEPYWLVITTGIAYGFYDLILWLNLDIRKDKFDKSFVFVVINKGKDIMIDRLLGKVAILFFGYMASKLNDGLYAIHCVCMGINNSLEDLTNNFKVFCLTKVNRDKMSFKSQCIGLIKQYGIWVIPLEYVLSLLLLFLYHGKVGYLECLPWLMVYLTQCIGIIYYESMGASLSCYSRTEVLRYGGLIGIAVRIPFVWITYSLGFGLVGFALAGFIDYACRGIYFYWAVTNHESKISFSRIEQHE